jgi:hypothetical protein
MALLTACPRSHPPSPPCTTTTTTKLKATIYLLIYLLIRLCENRSQLATEFNNGTMMVLGHQPNDSNMQQEHAVPTCVKEVLLLLT